ncbi:16819_t:CDS:2, partial [Funneliformis geosporum]
KNETDEYLKQQLIIHQSQLESGQKRTKELKEDLDKMRKELLGGGTNLMNLLGLDKLKTTDKIMIIDLKTKLGETTEQLENKVKEFSPYYTNLEPYQRGLILIGLTLFLILVIYWLTKSDKKVIKDDKKEKEAEEKIMRQMAFFKKLQLEKELQEDAKLKADKEVKKIASTLIKKYQEEASIFPDGDRNEKFYFSRAASYNIHFPFALREHYIKGKEAEQENCFMLKPKEDLILSDTIKT